MNIIYTNSETFSNELIVAIKNQTTNTFHQKYRHSDFFLIDDIQFLSGKDASQEEFFHTFNELYQCGKQIVITSDRPPKDINIIADRLKSRFESVSYTHLLPKHQFPGPGAPLPFHQWKGCREDWQFHLASA